MEFLESTFKLVPNSLRPVIDDEDRLQLMQQDVGLYDRELRLAGDIGVLYLTNCNLYWVSGEQSKYRLSLSRVKLVLQKSAFLTSSAKIIVSIGGSGSVSDQKQSESHLCTWICGVCEESNTLALFKSSLKCSICGIASMQADVQVQCRACTFINSGRDQKCVVCDTLLWPEQAIDEADVNEISTREAASLGPNYIKLSFRSGGQSAFFTKLKQVLSAKSWIQSNPEVQQTEQQHTKQQIGLSGLLNNLEQKRSTDKATLNEAFQDLDSLMAKSKMVVQMVSSYAEKMQYQTSAGSTVNKRDDITDLKDAMKSLGLSNIVTRDVTGDLYISELSTQLRQFLEPILSRLGAVSMTDAFCLYNKARGMSLISANDMHDACMLWNENDKSSLKVQVLKSGLKLITHSGFDLERVLKQLFQSIPYVNALILSEHTKLSIALAQEELLAIEEKGVLCRDETEHQIQFYSNIF
ncbi:hypothetical protein MIR68_011703 [Amoeboaphelidium protococcarum]|nr:hypothetical protein MIR68_011703 [Amoeboaphelidium protococcarum]